MPSGAIPTTLDLRSRLLPVKDQGGRGTCLAFATTAAHEMARLTQVAEADDLAEEVLYWRCKQVDGDHVPGTSFASASDALIRWGQPRESLWPYDPTRNDTDDTYQAPVEALDANACFRAQASPVVAAVDPIKALLLAGTPVMLGIRISLAFMNPNNGYIALPTPEEVIDEGHAVLIVGYQESEEKSGAWLIRNSWGTDWGLDGYGYLPYDYLEAYGGETWAIKFLAVSSSLQ